MAPSPAPTARVSQPASATSPGCVLAQHREGAAEHERDRQLVALGGAWGAQEASALAMPDSVEDTVRSRQSLPRGCGVAAAFRGHGTAASPPRRAGRGPRSRRSSSPPPRGHRCRARSPAARTPSASAGTAPSPTIPPAPPSEHHAARRYDQSIPRYSTTGPPLRGLRSRHDSVCGEARLRRALLHDIPCTVRVP